VISTDPASHRVLTRGQIDQIHDASMKVLEQTGVRVDSSEARALLKDAGAFVSGDGTVRIPARLIEWAAGVAPSNLTIYDRTGREAMRLGRRRSYFGTGSDTPNVIDPRTDERRPAVLSDIADFARVCDALPSIDFVMCMGIASDLEPATAELHHALAMLRNTTKPFVFTALDLAAARNLTAMLDVVAGGREAFRERPFALMYNEPVSPLGFARDNMEKLLLAAEIGVPSVFMSGLLCGGTSPVTAAGGLVLGNAESLAGVLIAQLKRKGAPVVSGGGILGMDMRAMTPSYSTPEFMLTMAAMAELAQYYGLPSWGYAGCSDAKTFDAQAAADTAEWVLMAALSGSNLVHDIGFLESGLTSSFDQLVFADEVIAKCARMVGGIAVDEESLATAAIAEVGHGGHFLSHRHTAKHFRENWPSGLEDRKTHGSWVAAGSQTMAQRIRAKVLDLLETHEPPELSADVDAELVRLVEDAAVTTSGAGD
jgi:trimethylamine--corrinoid protein Co-methyltransferase